MGLKGIFTIGVALGCEGEEDYDKRWAALLGTIEVRECVERGESLSHLFQLIGKQLSTDLVKEFSVVPSANPLDHFSPTEALLSTNAALSIFEDEAKCAHRIEHPRLTITAIG